MEPPGVDFAGRADRLWEELRPLLVYSGRQIIGAGIGGSSYNGGITIPAGDGKGDPFICASELAELLQNQTRIQISI